MLNFIFRHGSRRSTDFFLDGGDEKTHNGPILPSGQRTSYELGKLFRKDYVETEKFLKPYYSHLSPDVEILSCDRERCSQSTQSFLIGLYPPGSGPTIPDDVPEAFLIPPYVNMKG